jgi:CRP-like cAMP-binding protein
MTNLSESLRNVEAFSELDGEEIAALARAMTLESHGDGHVFIKEGDARRSMQDAVWLLLSGVIRVTRSGDPTKALSRDLAPGELFGLISLVDRGARTATCAAVGPVETAALNRAAFEHLLHSNAELACKFQLIVARQLARDFDRLQRTLRAALANTS